MKKLNLKWTNGSAPDIDDHNLQLMTDGINELADETEALGNKLSEISGMTTKSYSLVDTQSGEQSKSMTYPKNATHIIMMATHNDILEGSAIIDLGTNTITTTAKTVEVDLFNKYVGTLWNENHIENNTVEAYKGEGNFILHWNGDDGFGDETVTINNGVLTAISSYNTLGVAIIAITEGMTINAKDVYYEDGKNVEETKATLMPKTGVWMDEWELSPRKIRLGNVDQPQNTTIEEDRIRVYENNEDDTLSIQTEIVEGDVRISNNNPAKGKIYTYSLWDIGEQTTTIKHDLSKLSVTDKNLEKRVTNLEYASQGILYRADVDDSEAITKSVDNGALPYASLDVIGCKSLAPKNLVSEILKGANLQSNGVITTSTSYDMAIAKVESGKTYTVKTDEASCIYGFYTSKPVINSTTYDKQRVISSNKTIVIPSGVSYIAFRTNSNYQEAQIEQGSVSTDYQPYFTGIKNANLKEIVSKSENGTEISKIDVSTLINKYFPQGMRSAGSVSDVIDLVNGKAIKKFAVIDMSAPNWSKYTASGFNTFFANLSDRKKSGTNYLQDLYRNNDVYVNSLQDKDITFNANPTMVHVRDDSCVDASAFKSAINGHLLIYELETYEETDIAPEDIEKFKYLTVEGGGTLYFKTLDEFDVAIPTTETFAIKTGGAL